MRPQMLSRRRTFEHETASGQLLVVCVDVLRESSDIQEAHTTALRRWLKEPMATRRSHRRGGLSPASLRRVQIFVEANLDRPLSSSSQCLSDPGRARRFYVDQLGFEVRSDDRQYSRHEMGARGAEGCIDGVDARHLVRFDARRFSPRARAVLGQSAAIRESSRTE